MLNVTYNEQSISLDRFFESLVYRHIIDSDLPINEKNILMFVTRKTIGYDKINDNIGFKEFTWNTKLSESTVRKIIKELVSKELLTKEVSRGGKSNSRARYTKYQLHRELLSPLIDYWIEIKEDNGFLV